MLHVSFSILVLDRDGVFRKVIFSIKVVTQCFRGVLIAEALLECVWNRCEVRKWRPQKQASLEEFCCERGEKSGRGHDFRGFFKKDECSEGILLLPEEWSTRETLTILEEGRNMWKWNPWEGKGPRPNSQRNGQPRVGAWCSFHAHRSVWAQVLVADGTVGMTVFPKRYCLSRERWGEETCEILDLRGKGNSLGKC